MILENLYKEALIKPVDDGANELYAVSGYASATFANRHLSELNDDVKINLIIGMPGKRSDYLGYVQLINRYRNRFNAYYFEGNPPVHSKTYGWFNDSIPIQGFAGSANYSQPGFFNQYQINQLTEESPVRIHDFFESLLDKCIKIEDYSFEKEKVEKEISAVSVGKSVVPGGIEWEIPNKRVRISFLTSRGELPKRSGLNWGQRPEEGREPNQAYLSLRKDSRKEGFLPPIAYTFTLITDDNHSIDCAVAQQGRKAIHSNRNNSEFGIYFRERLGVPLGSLVTVDHLKSYGRTDYTIEKIDSETFLLDFST